MTERQIESLESGYEAATGETARVEWVSWHKPDYSDAAAYFDSDRLFKVGKHHG